MKIILALLIVCISCSSTKEKGQPTVEHVDLERMNGNWYEIARYETPAQKDCGAARIYITVKKDKVDLMHECRDKFTGKKEDAHGVAEVTNKKTNAELKASYVPIFQNWGMFGGSIWIIGLDNDYQYAILGHPTHKHFWIISRQEEMKPEIYEELVKLAESKGYKKKLMVRVPTWN
jgi:apolipoprotein D and lipocalin family protein